MKFDSSSKYILLVSLHGLIRKNNLELGRDADTGGQIKYVLELAEALSNHAEITQVDLLTRRLVDPQVSLDYSQEIEDLTDKARIIRIECGDNIYIPKEELWDFLDNFSDNALAYLNSQPKLPDIIHSHYADAGYVGTRLAHQLGIPLVHTGHSLGRIKRKRLLASGMKRDEIEQRYKISRRIIAEEETLGSAERVITSTFQEVDEQYVLYDYYQPNQMRVIPPGVDLNRFFPPQGDEWSSSIFFEISKFLKEPQKPIILALSRPDRRKNIVSLIEAYAASSQLQKLANLVIIAGNREDIRDLEEGAKDVLTEIILTIDQYDLYGKVAYPRNHKPDEVPILYRLAVLSKGVFVNPALTEPFGLTLLEAAASGLPIVATEDGGPIDIIRNCNNGFSIDPLDTADIEDKLLQVLSNPQEWKSLSENGCLGVRYHYSWSSHVEKYVEVLRPIIEGSEPSMRMSTGRRPMLYHSGAIVTGIDLNLLGDREALDEFIRFMRANRNDISFCVATGRRLDSALKILRKHRIPLPDALITSVGTEIYYSLDLTRDDGWAHHIDYLWNLQAVRRRLAELPGLKLQPKDVQSQFKISYYYDPSQAPSIEDIKRLLLQSELTVNPILSFGQYLDIIPVRASKGYALRWFVEQWDIPLKNALTIGGSGADEDIMRGNMLSVVVKNRHDEELSDLTEVEPIYFSGSSFAAGIMDGIAHYNFVRHCKDTE